MEKIRKGDIVQALSVHSSRISACIATLDEENRPSIIGLGRAEGKLLGKKGVLDIDALSRAIRDSLKMAQEEAGIESPKALIGISGGSIEGENSRGIIKLRQRGEEITDKNVREVLKVANATPANMARELIHSIPRDFIIDGQENIRNPVGLHGVKLETEALLITAHLPFLQNITKSLNLAGYDLEDIAFSGIAASQCVLSEETAGKCVIIVEIDNNFTTLSLFFDNLLHGVDILDKSVIANGALETLKERVDKIRGNKPISKIILSGGGYIHEDFIEKMDSVFGIPSQMAFVRNVIGRAKDINNPAYVSSIGLALYGLYERREDLAAKRVGRLGLLRKATKRVGEFIEEYF
jgi:cell division protein FtsA